jgi:hypothetical protein
MAGAIQPLAARAGVSFELERAEVQDDRLVLTGRWSGVRGMRFMRPTLVVDDRPLLATLDHKPWAPDGDPWVAAFPWPGGKVNPKQMVLTVAPTVTVPLVPGAKAAPAKPRAAESPPKAATPEAVGRIREDRLETEIGFLREELQAAVAERDALRAQLDATRDRASETEEQVRSSEAGRDELRAARSTAERERDRVAAQLDEAIRERDAAVRTRERMEAQRDEAVQAMEAVEAARDQALAERAEAVSRRDEVLLAHEALQRQVNATLADDDRARFSREDAPAPEDVGPDEPIGVRTIPAARTVAPELDRTRRPPRRDVSRVDLWAIRVFGSIAAVCFIALLVMILRVFL